MDGSPAGRESKGTRMSEHLSRREAAIAEARAAEDAVNHLKIVLKLMGDEDELSGLSHLFARADMHLAAARRLSGPEP